MNQMGPLYKGFSGAQVNQIFATDFSAGGFASKLALTPPVIYQPELLALPGR